MEGFIVEEVYFVRAFHPSWAWAADQSFSSPELALNRAQELSKELDCQVAVSCDARNWVMYDGGQIIPGFPWEHFYSGEPSELYNELMKALGEELKSRRAESP
jgi:hypothetical protein